MSWDDPDEPVGDEPFLPPLPPEDRLWRHPSEIGAPAGRPAPGPSHPRGVPVWGIAGVSGLLGAVLTMGVIALVGGLGPHVIEREVVERVATPSVVNTSRSSGNGVVEVARRISPAITRLSVETADGTDTGSGVLFRDNGYLLTNAHVVADASSIVVELADGTHHQGELIGADELTDIAVVKIGGDHETFPVAVLGSAVNLLVGQATVAIGSPAGLVGGPSVTTGVISALGRRVTGPVGDPLHDMIQTDAPIAPGSSGGALVDGGGAVIGITTAIAVTEVGAEGLGFATPIDIARSIADDLIELGRARHVLLGVEGRDLDMSRATDLKIKGGALVVRVVTDSPADVAGLAPGDVILRLDDEEVHTMSGLVVALRNHRPGDAVTVTFLRSGSTQNASLTLVERHS